MKAISLEQTRKSVSTSILVVLLALLSFFKLAGDVYYTGSLAWDVPVSLAMQQYQSIFLDTLMVIATYFGGEAIVIMAAIIFVGFWWNGQPRYALFSVIALVGSVGLGQLLKSIFMRPRPNLFTPLVHAAGYSFPSGHTLAAISLYGFWAFALWQARERGIALCAGILAVSIGISRVYLGVHYASDVLASWAVGAIWLTVIYWLCFSNFGRKTILPKYQ